METDVTIDDLKVVMDALQYLAGSYDELELQIATIRGLQGTAEKQQYDKELEIRRHRGNHGTMASRVEALKESLLRKSSET
jgi:hypothetical protein